MSSPTGVVFKKELLDGLRDRRSLISALLYSLLGPLMMAFALQAVARSFGDDRPLEVAVAGAERAPQLIAHLRDEGVTFRNTPADLAAAIRSRELGLGLVIPADYAEKLGRSEPARVEVLFDSSSRGTAAQVARLERLLAGYGQQVAQLRLLARGIAPEVARPLDVQRRDFATAARRAAVAFEMLPIFLLMAAFVSAMNLAIDTTAGERERGSLEALLLHPVPPRALVVGKWLAASVVAVAGVTATLLVARQVLAAERLQDLEISLTLSGRQLAALELVLLPMALLAPALQMLVALFCRSFKEAQTYLSLLLLLPMVPGFAFSFGTIEPQPWMEAVPMLGQQVWMSSLVRGEPVGPSVFLLGLATLALAAVCLAATAWLLRHERVILGR